MADQDIVLRDPGAGTGAISFGGAAPVDGSANAALPVLGAAATGVLTFVGSAVVALPGVAVSGDGSLGFTGAATVELSAPAADATGLLAFAGSGAAVLLAPAADASGALAFIGVGSPTFPALAVAASGTVTSDSDDDRPVYITLGRAVPLFQIDLGAAVPLYKITLGRPMSRLYVGGTAYITSNTVVDSRTGELTDNETVTFYVLTPSGTEVELVYGTAPTSGDEDAIIRTATGTYTLQVALTEERGEGEYAYSMQTTGGRGSNGSGRFTVYTRRI